MTAKEQIKKLALDLGMDLCGVASMDRFAGSPEGKHPESILPGCRSAIVIGVRLLDGATQINFRAFEEGRRDLKGIYGTYGYAMLPDVYKRQGREKSKSVHVQGKLCGK